MGLRHIVVYVDNDESARARIAYAAALAVSHEAHLSGVYRQRLMSIPTYASVHIPAPVIASYDAASDELTAAAQALFESLTREAGLIGEWRLLDDHLPEAIAREARYADLVVLAQSQGPELDLHESYALESVLLKTAGPVLAVPAAGTFAIPRRHALVAWCEGREAARAVHAALPLLREVRRVTVLNVGGAEADRHSGRALCAYLGRHGVEAEFVQRDAVAPGTAATLLSQAGEHGCELLVMGSYGHSRIYELVLGGVTRDMLAQMTLPILTAH